MKIRTKVIATIAIFTILAFLFTPLAPIGQHIWPEPEAFNPEPTSLQIGLLILYTFISSFGFAVGIAWLLYGYSYVTKVFTRQYAPWVYIAVFWASWSWWIHDIGHMTTHGSVAWLIFLEYTFHATIVVLASITALAFVKGRKSITK